MDGAAAEPLSEVHAATVLSLSEVDGAAAESLNEVEGSTADPLSEEEGKLRALEGCTEKPESTVATGAAAERNVVDWTGRAGARGAEGGSGATAARGVGGGVAESADGDASGEGTTAEQVTANEGASSRLDAFGARSRLGLVKGTATQSGEHVAGPATGFETISATCKVIS